MSTQHQGEKNCTKTNLQKRTSCQLYKITYSYINPHTAQLITTAHDIPATAEYQMAVGGDLILTKALRSTVFAVSSLFFALVVQIPMVTTIMTHDKVILESIGIATTL